MKIVVIGGRGLIGAKLVAMLGAGSDEVMAASRRSGVDTLTGEGLATALKDAAVVVDVSNAPSFQDAAAMKFFRASTQNLLAAEAVAGVGHHVLLSVVGSDRFLKNGYFRAKLAQEKLIRDSPIPYSIVQATQFFEFLKSISDAATHGNTVRVPPVLVQPIAADDIAQTIGTIATSAPLHDSIEVAGPEQFHLDEIVQWYLGARNDPREVISDPHARYFGAEPSDRSLMPGSEAQLGGTRFESWLGRNGTRAPCASLQSEGAVSARVESATLKPNEFRISEVPPGSVALVDDRAVFNVDGGFCATQATCTHRQGALSEGTVDGSTVTCPLHGAQFNIWTGAVVRGPARDPLKTYRVTVDGVIGQIEPG